MMRLHNLGITLLALTFSTCLFAQYDMGSQSLAAGGDYWPPWVTKATTRSATINWHGESGGTGVVEYATSAYYEKHKRFNKTAKSKVMATCQHVKLAGLKPNTSYIYKVAPSGSWGAFGSRTFRTMPLSGPFTFIVVSDSQEGHNYQRYDLAGTPYFIVGDGGGPCADIDPTQPHPVWCQNGEAKVLGYLKVTVYPKGNMAIAEEIYVAWVNDDESSETPQLFDPPVMGDAVAFPLSVKKE